MRRVGVSSVHLETLLGSSKTFPFRLRRAGAGNLGGAAGYAAYWDVSAATKILFEARRQALGDIPLASVVLNSAAPGADWLHGLVPVTLGTVDVAARVGTYDCALIVYFGAGAGVPTPALRGVVEVLDRPIFAPIPMPGGSYISGGVVQGVNRTGGTLLRGTAINLGPGGTLVPSTAQPVSFLDAQGLLLTDVLDNQPGLFITSGQLQLDDWTAVTGAVHLTPNATYYLDIPLGRLTATVPTPPTFGLLQVVGVAEDNATLDLTPTAYEVQL